tara:strand:+ start:138 stop:686 length:549 start_codon:yes stop_codon:yes gene_type:complete
MTDLSPEMLHRLLHCDPVMGVLTWKPRTPDLFNESKYSADRLCTRWNTRLAGKFALYTISDGYKTGRIFNRNYKAHRVIWAMVHGKWPADQIDHINGIRGENRIENLREVTNAENMRNAAMPRINTSGVVGVHWYEKNGRWVAQIKANGKTKHLGSFIDKADAIAARAAAEIEYGYHENHGR